MDNRKYSYGGFELELTRRCNKACDHCANGEAQDITMSREIIDTLFDNVSDCEQITITGGEPTLELNTLDYLIDRIIASDWNTEIIQVTTNGKVRDIRLTEMLGKFCNSADNRKALLRISTDQFHERSEYEPALKFYYDAAKSISSKINVFATGSIISLKYAGRAKQYIDTHPEYCTGMAVLADIVKMNKRIIISDGYVPCMMHISVKGELGNLIPDQSFNTIDKMAFGSIMEHSMADLIDKNNTESLLTCAEHDAYCHANSWRFKHYEGVDGQLAMALYKKFIERMLYIRRWARENYPLCSAQDIIDHIPIYPIYNPRSEENVNSFFKEFRQLIKDIYLFSHFQNEPKTANHDPATSILLKSVNLLIEKCDMQWQEDYVSKHLDGEMRKFYEQKIKDISEEDTRGYLMMLLFLIALLTEANENDPAMPSVYLPGFKGDKWNILTQSKAFQELDELHTQYIYHQKVPDNSKIFPCNPD